MKKISVGLIVALLLAVSINSALTLANSPRPVAISLVSDKVTPAFAMRFQVFASHNLRQNVNVNSPIEFPNDYLIEIDSNANYPLGQWNNVARYNKNDLRVVGTNTYTFPAPNVSGHYRVVVKNQAGNHSFMEIFRVASEPFMFIDRLQRPGSEVFLRIFKADGTPWTIANWGIDRDQYQIDVFRVGGIAFQAHASTGLNRDKALMIRSLGEGRYSFMAGERRDGFYINLQQGSGAHYRLLHTTSYQVDGNQAVARPPEEDGPPVPLEPNEIEQEDFGPVCDLGERCVEAEAEAEVRAEVRAEEEREASEASEARRRSRRAFSVDKAARMHLPEFRFVNWRPKLILKKINFNEYDFEKDVEGLRQSPFVCRDLEGHWSRDLVSGLLQESKFPVEVDNGEENANCRPDRAVLRERLLSWLVFVFYSDLATEAESLSLDNSENPYEDLDENFGKYVLAATRKSIVAGQGRCAALKTTNCRFGTGQPVNRAELLKMVVEASGASLSLEDLRAKFPLKDPKVMFTDIEGEDEWFYLYLYFATANNVIEGVRTPDGKAKAAMSDPVSYSQAAKIIQLMSKL